MNQNRRTLQRTDRSLPIALLRAREAVMAPIRDMLADAGVTARTQRFVPTQSEFEDFAAASEWVVVAEDAATLAILDDDPRWVPLRPNPGGRPWTDDYSNIFGAMNW